MSILTFVRLLAVAEHYPKYGDLFILLDEAEQHSDNTAHRLAQSFAKLYPHIPVTRQDTFLKTVLRLAAPTQPSAIGPSKLQGLALKQYKERIWRPTIRHTQGLYSYNNSFDGVVMQMHVKDLLLPLCLLLILLCHSYPRYLFTISFIG